MKKHTMQRPESRTRVLPPQVKTSKAGVTLLCPFCTPPHPILPGEIYPCGSEVRVTVAQEVFSSHFTKHKNIHCLKCHTVGGEMVRYNNGFVHLVDCVPGTRLLTVPPTFSQRARFVFGLPKTIRKNIEKRSGPVQEVREIDEAGKETGKVLGYFFLKKGVQNA
jgi:hypothetical protein